MSTQMHADIASVIYKCCNFMCTWTGQIYQITEVMKMRYSLSPFQTCLADGTHCTYDADRHTLSCLYLELLEKYILKIKITTLQFNFPVWIN